MAENYAERHEELVHTIERDEHELRQAVQELTGAARAQLGITEHIRQHPLSWVLAGFLVGMWLGTRESSANRK